MRDSPRWIEWGCDTECAFIGTTAALIMGGMAAGGALGAAAIGAHAAGKAGETQAESADQALQLQREMYQQQRQDTAPWREQGGQAVQTLGALMGLPSGPTQSQQGPSMMGSLVKGMAPIAQRLAQQADRGQVTSMAASKGFPVSSSYPDQMPQHPGAQNASGYVMMEAPTGERQQIPREQVEAFQSAGARLV